MQALILDDEVHCTEVLSLLLKRHCPEVKTAHVFTSPGEALDFLRQQPVDILFLDVEMPYMSGFDFLAAAGDTGASVVFTTAYDSYALQAFRYNAIDYLLKPIDAEELKNAVSKAARKENKPDHTLLENLIRSFIPQEKQEGKIAIHTQEGIFFLLPGEIIRCESDGSYSHIHLIGKSPVMVSKNLKELEDMIRSPRFFRIHKSHLINMDHILKVSKADGGEVVMANNDLVPISRHKRQEFLGMFKS